MEVGDQTIQHLEAIPGVNEDFRPAGGRFHVSVLPRPRFHSAAGGRTHTDDATAVCLGTVDKFSRFGRDDTVFAVHIMVEDILLLHRAERTQTNMEGHIAEVYAHSLHLLQQFRRKVKTSRRGSSTAYYAGIHRLIPLTILQFRLNVGRQRHLAQPIQYLKENALIIKADKAIAIGQLIHDLARQRTITKGYLRPLFEALTGAHKTFPHLLATIDQQQHLAGTATGQTLTQQTGRQHAGVVENETIPFTEIVCQIIKMPMG